jgi:hypothetical protein
MAVKKVLAAQAVSALKEQTKRFDSMVVLLAKGADIATSQENEIAEWASKLIAAVTKIQKDTQLTAAESRKRVQERLCELKAESESKKRKILDTIELDSSRTIKANFRLIFGPRKETEYSSKSTKHLKTTSLGRINAIRELTEPCPDGVIAFCLTHCSKVWTECSSKVLDGLMDSVKKETEQPWPADIVNIMRELENERPMSDEFRKLRGIVTMLAFDLSLT